MKKVYFFLLLIFYKPGLIEGQSYHFSQFFSTPLLINPANTGFIEGPYRVSSNFRSQGMANGSPYYTGYVSGDSNLFESEYDDSKKPGFGLYIMSDKSLNGALLNNSAALSVAYHVGLDDYGEYNLGIGLQGVYHQRRIDQNKLSFGNQFGSNGYDPTIPTGEAFVDINDINKSYFDVNVGILYNAILEGRSLFAGVSIYNALNHKQNILIDEFRMPLRLNAQIGGQFDVGYAGRVYYSLTSITQAKANDLTLGGAYGLQLTENNTNEINLGMWYRLKDAIIPYIGYHTNTLQFGLSYDFTTSSLKTSSKVRNGYELNIIFKSVDIGKIRHSIPWY